MTNHFLAFEKPIVELNDKIEALIAFKQKGHPSEIKLEEEIQLLKKKSHSLTKTIFASLGAWEIVQLARHPLRPYPLDYISLIFTEFQELAGDRAFADDKALVGGLLVWMVGRLWCWGNKKGVQQKRKLCVILVCRRQKATAKHSV
ncbi:hypothetical protein MIB42_002885 [Providencia rettgeri]|nr:hypothetical protein [Providencia rettgeri]MCG9940759.1 hypothetical protein [Providencia rettgeri]